MKKSSSPLTELEGAVLSEMGTGDAVTAYQVRRAFETSRSQEWSGSAGAVYPAIRRMTERGLIATQSDVSDGRGTARLSLTKEGKAALQAWASDAARAVGPGVDPFRMRASEWMAWPAAKRRSMANKLERALRERIAELETAIEEEAEHCSPRTQLDLELQHSRLEWLRRTVPAAKR